MAYALDCSSPFIFLNSAIVHRRIERENMARLCLQLEVDMIF